MEVDAPGPAMVIVDRDPDMAGERMVAEWRDQGEPREQPLRDPPIIGIGLAVAPAVEREPERRALDLEHDIAVGPDVVVGLGTLVERILVDFETMDIRHVAGVDA